MVSLHPSRPPLATIGRALTLIQVIFYLPLTLDVGGSDAFLALSAALASYYWALSSLRLATRKTRLKWLGDLFATFQFLVVPACLAICWAVYCPPEKNYFFVRWARTAAGGTGAAGLIGRLPLGAGSQTSHLLASSPSSSHLFSSASSSSPPSLHGAHPATPPHLAAILQAISPLLKGTNSHPYLEGLFDICSEAILYLARKVPGWWGTFLRLSSPAFSLLEGSATLLVIQVLGTGCRYIIATSLTSGVRSAPPEARGGSVERKARGAGQDGEDLSEAKGEAGSKENGHCASGSPNGRSGVETTSPRRSGRLRRLAFAPFKLLSSIGIRGAEAWQLFFLLSSAIIYVVSGWALFLAFDGVAARGGAAALMMGVSVASVAWLTAIAFAIGKGNVVETALIFAYTSWNIFALSSASSLSFVSDPLALVRSFKGQVTSSYLDRLAPRLAAAVPDALQSFVAESIELVKVTFGQSWTFLGALASALPASVVVSLVYRLMVLYAASRILPFLCGPSARRRQEQWPPRHRRSSRQSKHGRSGQHSSTNSGYSSSATSSVPTSSYSGSSGSSSSGASSDGDCDERTGSSSARRRRESETASESQAPRANGQDQHHRRSSSSASSSSSSSSSAFSSSSASTSDIEDLSPSDSSAPETDTDAESEPEPFGSFISFIVSYARLILIAVYSHLLLLDQSHQAMWRFSTVSVTLGLWTMELLLGNQGDEIVEFASAWQQQQKQQRYRQRSRHGHTHGHAHKHAHSHERYRRSGLGSGAGAPRRSKAR